MLGSAIDPGSPLERGHPLARGLVSWWLPLPGQQGSLLRDIAGGWHAALTNGPAWTAGLAAPFGGLSFDGSDDYADIGTNVTYLATGSPFSFLFTGVIGSSNVTLGTFQYSGSATLNFSQNNYGGSYQGWSLGDAGWQPQQDGRAYPGNGSRFHVLYTYNGAGTGSAANYGICSDGVPGTVANAGAYGSNGAGHNKLGRYTAGAGLQFNGRMHAAAFWNRALSADEAWRLYEEERRGWPGLLRRSSRRTFLLAQPQQAGGATVFLPGRRVDLGNPLDRSHPLARGLRDCVLFGMLGAARNHNLATNRPGGYQGSPAWATADGIQGVYATGGASATLADEGNLAAGDLTARLVFKPVSWSSTYHIATIKTAGNSELRFAFNSNGDISFTEVGKSQSFTGVSTGCTAGKVWDVVLTRMASSGAVQYYVNGQPVSTSITLTGTAASPGTTYLGYAADGNTNMDAVYLSWQTWTRVLAASEIRRLYSEPAAFLRKIQPMPWAFDGGSGGGSLVSRTAADSLSAIEAISRQLVLFRAASETVSTATPATRSLVSARAAAESPDIFACLEPGVTMVGASGSGYQASTTGYSWSHSCTGTDRLLIVDVAVWQGPPSTVVPSVTYNGVAMTLKEFISDSADEFGIALYNFALLAPASGSNTVAVTLDGTAASAAAATSYVNVNQSIVYHPSSSTSAFLTYDVYGADWVFGENSHRNGQIFHVAMAANVGPTVPTSVLPQRSAVSGALGTLFVQSDDPERQILVSRGWAGLPTGAAGAYISNEVVSTTPSTRKLVAGRAASEAPSASEAIARIFAGARAAGESPSVSESPGVSVVTARSAAEPLLLSESVSRAFAGARQASELPSLATAVARVFVGARSAAESPSLGSVPSRVLVGSRQASESPALATDASRAFAGARSVVESPALSDSAVVMAAGVARSAEEAVILATAASRIFAASRQAAASAAVSEVLSRLFAAVRSAAESAGLSTSAAAGLLLARSAADSPAASDASARAVAAARSASEAPVAAESLFRILASNRQAAEAVTAGTGLSSLVARLRTATDSVAIADSAVRAQGLSRSVSDSAALATAVLFVTGGLGGGVFDDGLWSSIFI